MAVTIEELRYVYTADTAGFDKAQSHVNSKLDQSANEFGNKMQKTTQSWSSAMAAAAGIGMTAINVALVAFARDAITTYARMDALTKGMESLMGSASAAGKEIARLKEIAKLPGLGVEQAIRASIQLQAVGMSADGAANSIKVFGNALALGGGGKDNINNVILGLTQIMAKGKISAEEINQIQENGVFQLRAAMQKVYGTADTEVLQKMHISAEGFVASMTSELAKLAPVGASTKNSLENLDDSWNNFKTTLVESVAPALNTVIDGLSSVIEWLKQLPSGVKSFAVIGTAAAAAAGNVIVLRNAWLSLMAVQAISGSVKTGVADIATQNALNRKLQINLAQASMEAAISGGSATAGGASAASRARSAMAAAIDSANALTRLEGAADGVAETTEASVGIFGRMGRAAGTAWAAVRDGAIKAALAVRAFVLANPYLVAAVVIIGAIAAAYALTKDKLDGLTPAQKRYAQGLEDEANKTNKARMALQSYIDAKERANPGSTKGATGQLTRDQQRLKELQAEQATDKRESLGGSKSAIKNFGNWWFDHTDTNGGLTPIRQRYSSRQDEINQLNQKIKADNNKLITTANDYKNELQKPVTEWAAKLDQAKKAGDLAGQKEAEVRLAYYERVADQRLKAAKYDSEKGHKAKYNLGAMLGYAQGDLDYGLNQAKNIGYQVQNSQTQAINQANLGMRVDNATATNQYLKAAILNAEKEKDASVASALERDLTTGEYKNAKPIRQALLAATEARYKNAIADAKKTEAKRLMGIAMAESGAVSSVLASKYMSQADAYGDAGDISKTNFNALDKSKQNFKSFSDFMISNMNKGAAAKGAAGNETATNKYRQDMAALLDLARNGENITQRKIALEYEYAEAVKKSSMDALKYKQSETASLLDMAKSRKDSIKEEITAEISRKNEMAGMASITSMWENAQKLGQQQRYVDPSKQVNLAGKAAEFNGVEEQIVVLKEISSGVNAMILKLGDVAAYAQ